MNKLFFGIVLQVASFTSFCQKIHLDLFTGIANYKGDLQYNPSSGKQISFKQPKAAVGVGIEYELFNKLCVRFGITDAAITADDKKQPDQVQRNLNFTSSIFDVMLGAQYYITDPNTHFINPYVFAGLAYFHFNPYTYDTSGQKVFLRPLSTEGEGFVNGRDPYSLSQLAIPFGGGIKFSISDKVRAGIELSLRKTFTDYLDDVSTTYVDANLLLTNRGQQAVDLAYRGYEVNAGPYPAAGTQRGTLAAKDWYYFTWITVSYALGNGTGSGKRNGKKSKLGCPVLR